MIDYLWVPLGYFGNVILYWLGFTISFFSVHPWLYKKDKKKFEWIYKILIPVIFIAYAVAFLLKIYFHIPRPCAGLSTCPSSYSFPSGHASVMFALTTIVAILFRKKKYWIPVLILAILVSYSRLALNVHRPIDLIGGAIVGSSVSILYYYIYEKLKKINRFTVRKIIHLSGIIIIPIYLYLPHKLVNIAGLIACFLYTISEYMRVRGVYFPCIQDITKYCLKKQEIKKIAVSPLMYGLTLLILIQLPFKAFLTGVISLVIGDSMSALVGYNFANRNKKTVMGSVSFFLSTFIALTFVWSLQKALVLALFGTLIEYLIKGDEENMIIGLSTAFLSFL